LEDGEGRRRHKNAGSYARRGGMADLPKVHLVSNR
jgi:hypothetical protein